MAGEWRSSTWGKEISLEYGKGLRGYDAANGKYRVFGSNGPIGWTTQPLTSGPGVILGRKGAYRGVQYWPDPFYVIDTAYYVVPKTELDMRWLYYTIQHYKLGEVDDGSPIPSTTRSAVYVLGLEVPPPNEQRAIAHILGTLDDKIEMNRRMNTTLEAMAQALFKSWFVDFDPVRSKAEGRDGGLPKSLADPFPDSFEDSELGEIPRGWEVSSIYTAAEVIYGAPFASDKFNSDGIGKPLIRIRDLADESPGVFTAEEHPKGYLVKPGDIVVGMDGEFRAYLWGGVESWLNQRVCVFKPRTGYSSPFVLHSIVGLLAEVEATETATTVIHIGKNDIDQFKIVVPTEPILTNFGRLAGPLFESIVVNKQESYTLAALRDTLLPKLISGKLRIHDANQFGQRNA